MADMNKRHHNLIIDAVAKGITEAMECLVDQHSDETRPDEIHIRKARLETVISCCLERNFVEMLKYTHDKFDEFEFQTAIRNRVKELAKK